MKRTPYDGLPAQTLATARLAAGDHSDRTLDYARRAARFARSEESIALLRDTYVARGQRDKADEISERLNRLKKAIGTEAEPPSTESDAA